MDFILEYDYRVVDKIGKIAWDRLKRYKTDQKTDYIIEFIKSQLYPAHTAESYRLSLDNLIKISETK